MIDMVSRACAHLIATIMTLNISSLDLFSMNYTADRIGKPKEAHSTKLLF